MSILKIMVWQGFQVSNNQLKIQWVEYAPFPLRQIIPSNHNFQNTHLDQVLPEPLQSAPSITAQDAYIRKLVEILPDFEYNQVEQAVNLRRENMTITDHPVSNLDASSLTESFTDENDYSSLESVMPVDFEEAYYENNVKTQQTYRRSESAQVVHEFFKFYLFHFIRKNGN